MSDGRHETDSDHILKLCFLAMMISPYLQKKHSVQKLLELALVHDIVEAECGDIPYFQQLSDPGIKEVKKRKEKIAIEKYRDSLPPLLGKKIYDLFMEYENHSSFEARVIHALDTFEGNLQCNKENFGSRYWKIGVGKRVQAMENHIYGNDLDENIIRDIETALVNLSHANKEKCEQEGL